MARKSLTNTEDESPALGDQMKKIAAALDNAKAKSLTHTQSDEDDDPRDPRSTRQMDTRDAELAPLTWRPADVLPDPPQREGWVHRWVRGSTRGELDSVNMARAMREHWRPCSPSDYPEIVEQMPGSSNKDSIEFGGLILCRIPAELARQRQEYYKRLSLRQINSVNARLLEEQGTETRVRYINEGESVVNNLPPVRAR